MTDTNEEVIMRLKYETYDQARVRLSQWHNWFAWYPIWENGTVYWLETIERKYAFRALFSNEYHISVFYRGK